LYKALASAQAKSWPDAVPCVSHCGPEHIISYRDWGYLSPERGERKVKTQLLLPKILNSSKTSTREQTIGHKILLLDENKETILFCYSVCKIGLQSCSEL